MSEVDFCTLCNVRLESSAVSFSHYNGQMHKKKLTNPVAAEHKCDICNISCTGEIPFEAHLKSKKHQHKITGGTTPAVNTNIKDISEEADDQNNDEDVPLWCEVCRKSYKNKLMAKLHFFSDNHKKKLSILEEIKNGEISLLHCVTCVIKCLDEDQMTIHMNSAAHRKRLENKPRNARTKKTEDGDKIDNGDDGASQKSPPVSEYCDVCDVKLMTASQVTAHMNGLKHKKKLEKPVSPLAAMLKCNLCNVSCTGTIPFEAHIKSNKHLKKMSKMSEQNETSDNVQSSAPSDFNTNALQNSFDSTIQVQAEYPGPPIGEKEYINVTENNQQNLNDHHIEGSTVEELGGLDSEEINTISGNTVPEQSNIQAENKNNEQSGTFKNSFVPAASKIVNQTTSTVEPPKKSLENEKQILNKIDHVRHSASEEIKSKPQVEKVKIVEKIEGVKQGSFKNSFVPETPQLPHVAPQPPKSSRENDKQTPDKKDLVKSSAMEETSNVVEENQEDQFSNENSKKSKRSKKSSLFCELCPVKGLDEKQMAAHLAEHKKQHQDKKSHSKEPVPTRSLRKRRSESGSAKADDAKAMKFHERDS